MTTELLTPQLDLLTQEYVLVQAWKKTSAYIRYHNWYSDTLALDLAAVNLPRFLGSLAEQLRSPEQWRSEPLRMVPAPKSQPWRVTRAGWAPVDVKAAARKLRPLAHVTLRDQVAATAIMLCLADRVETIQGDTRHSTSPKQRRRVVSYGNRLFCDSTGGVLRHRWGSGKLYRAYYQDYRTFLSRAGIVGDELVKKGETRITVVYSDLRQFFDRVRPHLITNALRTARGKEDDDSFYKLARRVLNWRWDPADEPLVRDYRETTELSEFQAIALPQGLVSAGFFSNVALLAFDEQLRAAMGSTLWPGVQLHDVCRYVDDLRLVLTVSDEASHQPIESRVKDWLQALLDKAAPDLRVSEDKTKAAAFRGDERALVRQSRKMARIQAAVSGGFDAIGGEEILEAVQGLIRSQQRFSEADRIDSGWILSPVPDVRDATVARFAAGRFRTTFRSLRPLLPDGGLTVSPEEHAEATGAVERPRVGRTKAGLDDDARAFALGLIQQWIEDPSNVRLLRIGLDIWPAADVLENILAVLKPYTQRRGGPRAPRLVAWYCLSELFRAAAIETGIVEDAESLPAGLDITAYRTVLREEADRLSRLPQKRLPWYLKQQITLFQATQLRPDSGVPILHRAAETGDYRRLVGFLAGKFSAMDDTALATFAILCRRAFLDSNAATKLTRRFLTARVMGRIASRDPGFAIELHEAGVKQSRGLSAQAKRNLCIDRGTAKKRTPTLASMVLDGGPLGPLRNELAVARFASLFLDSLISRPHAGIVTPQQVRLNAYKPHESAAWPSTVLIEDAEPLTGTSLYSPPSWCPPSEHWRFQLGFLLRFILTARPDFARVVRAENWREHAAVYRTPQSHWLQQRYSLFNAQAGFGDDWLPVSDWTESLLSALLSWPGCQQRELDPVIHQGPRATRAMIGERIERLLKLQGPSSGVFMLPVRAPWPIKPTVVRPLRACVVQTVIPGPSDFKPQDLMLSDPKTRARHRNHLSAALAAVERMLALRETHKGQASRLDLLVLPELAVHPRDVATHLEPFARAHKTIVLAGLAYERVIPGAPLVNSALWIVPEWSKARGLQVRRLRQGKQNLAALELKLNEAATRLQSFRPCQWLVGYQWSSDLSKRPLWMTASICYDATDLRLASDLRDSSDVFLIPALNQDVTTFDQMALSLHYHMFQMVVVANNGLFGGSNAYAPYRDAFRKQVFHVHGQPQASIAFLEIDNVPAFLSRRDDALQQAQKELAKSKAATGDGVPYSWKYPPAPMPSEIKA